MNMNSKLEEFFKKRPDMREKYEYPGTFKGLTEDIEKSMTAPRKGGDFFCKRIIKEVRRILLQEVSLGRLEDQLLQYPVISTADHMGLLNYKLLYNSNILFSEVIKKLDLPYMVVLATGNIPLNNMSHPRGFYFKKEKVNFFKSKGSSVPVFLFKNKLSADRKQGIESVIFSYDKKSITVEELKFFEFLFFECLEIEKASRDYETFSDQVTFINHKLWKYYFDESIRESLPDVIYLQSNEIINGAIIDELKQRDSLISMILLEPDIRKVFLENFNEIQGCWSEAYGSHFFWGISEDNRWIRLCLDNESNSLVGDDFFLELDREKIIDNLNSKKILPTTFLVFLIISFLEGQLPLGGFNQLEYLPQMQTAHIKSLHEIGMNDLADQFASRVTDAFICGMFPFDFDSGIDLIWHYNSHAGKFNGNLDRGLTQQDLDKILNMKVRDMIRAAIEVMSKNI